MPGDALVLGPLGHGSIAGIGPAVAGFLMAPEPRDAEVASRPLQDVYRRPDAHHQRLSQTCERNPELLQALGAEVPLARRAVALLPQLGLHDGQRQDRALATRLQQRLVVSDPQIPLEPDDLEPFHGFRSTDPHGLVPPWPGLLARTGGQGSGFATEWNAS